MCPKNSFNFFFILYISLVSSLRFVHIIWMNVCVFSFSSTFHSAFNFIWFGFIVRTSLIHFYLVAQFSIAIGSRVRLTRYFFRLSHRGDKKALSFVVFAIHLFTLCDIFNFYFFFSFQISFSISLFRFFFFFTSQNGMAEPFQPITMPKSNDNQNIFV